MQPQKPKRSWKKIVLISALVLGGLGILFGLYLAWQATRVSTNPFSLHKKLSGDDMGVVNILILGVGDPGHDGEKLSDTNIVASVDTHNHKLALISLPRDLRVQIPGHGYDKINTANSYGGVSLAEQTVESTLGLKINYYIKANFTGLKQIVDTVGGVDITNKTLLYDSQYPCDGNTGRSCGYRLAPGQYHLNGTQALKYARCRKGTCGSDFGRDERQQEVLQQVAKKALSTPTLINPAKFNGLLNSVSGNVKTDLSITDMKRLYDMSQKFDPATTTKVVLDTSPGGFLTESRTSSDLLPVGGNFLAIQAFVKHIFDFGPIYAERSTIIIENGTNTVGVAAKLQKKLVDSGVPITIDNVTSALLHDYTVSQIIDYSSGKVPKTLAYLQKQVGVAPTVASQTSPANFGSDVVVILGTDYAAKVSPSTTSSTNSNGSTSR